MLTEYKVPSEWYPGQLLWYDLNYTYYVVVRVVRVSGNMCEIVMVGGDGKVLAANKSDLYERRDQD